MTADFIVSLLLIVVYLINLFDFLYFVRQYKKRLQNLEDEIKSLKRVNGFLFCSFMEYIKPSDTSTGDIDV